MQNSKRTILHKVHETTREFHESSIVFPTIFFFSVSAMYFGGIIGIGVAQSGGVKFILGILTSFAVGKLFVIGHDACHGSFSPNRRLNRAFAAGALTMSFHLPRAWRFWHNTVHHAFTNDLTRDFVWRPLSSREYQTASLYRRWLEQIYRHHSGAGLGLYYFIEILAPKMLTASRNARRPGQKCVAWELCGFYIFHSGIAVWLAAAGLLWGNSLETGTPIVNVLLGSVGSLIYLCYAIGFVVYFNHTHPEIKWVMSGQGLGFVERQTSATVYLKFQGISEVLLPSGVMGHVAHHLDTRIPVRQLQKAQERLVWDLPVPIKIEVWSWAVQRRIMKSCKLYEPYEGMWTGFNGRAVLKV